MQELLARSGLGAVTTKYIKIYEIEEANEIRKQVDSYRGIDLVAMVFNFLDILAHGRSQSEILQEIAPNESAFRSLMRSWFVHSALFDILQRISKHGATVIITTDHGSILGARASLVHGNRDTSTNLRYKFGENINGDSRQTLLIRKPLEFNLPVGGSLQELYSREGEFLLRLSDEIPRIRATVHGNVPARGNLARGNDRSLRHV